MSFTVIEISDYYLTLTQGEQQLRELGCCLVENEQVIFGEQAWQQLLLKPLQSYNNYWQQLGYEKIHSDNNEVEHFADLAYLQLKTALAKFEQVDDVVILVSGHYNCEQLALLLGIVNACQLTVLRLINCAVTHMTSLLSDKQQNSEQLLDVWYVDIDLHQVSVSELLINGEVKLSQSQSFHQKGLIELVKHLTAWVNEFFILEYRYDAFDCAQTEQHLFNQIMAILPESKTNYQIIIHEPIDYQQINDLTEVAESTDNSRLMNEKTIVISEQQLQQQIQVFFSEIFDELVDKKQIVMSAEMGQLIAHTCQSAIWKIGADPLFYRFLYQHINYEQPPEKIELVSHLTLPSISSVETDTCKAVQSGEQATHLVHQGHIYPINQERVHIPKNLALKTEPLSTEYKPEVYLNNSQQRWFIEFPKDTFVFINDKPAINGQLLKIADQIKLSESNEYFTLAVLKGGNDLYGI